MRDWLGKVGVKTLFIEPGGPCENAYVESFNGKLRDELLNRESFVTLPEARALIERWRERHNTVRPHPALSYRPGPRKSSLRARSPLRAAPQRGAKTPELSYTVDRTRAEGHFPAARVASPCQGTADAESSGSA